MSRWLVSVALSITVFAAGCAKDGGTTGPSGPFNGTWTAYNPVTLGVYDTIKLTQTGSTIMGTDDTHSSQGTLPQTVRGTASGNTATVDILNGTSLVISGAVINVTGTGLTMAWNSAKAGPVVETFVPGTTPPTLSAEAYCAMLPSIGYGHFFYCGTVQGNLQLVNFPDGAHGFCQTAASNNLGLVGYVAVTYSGGTGYVDTQSGASDLCNNLGNQCPGYIRCTRQ